MGRLDDAMRRAAEEGAASDSVSTLDLQQEQVVEFPSEEPAQAAVEAELEPGPTLLPEVEVSDRVVSEAVDATRILADRVDASLSTKTVVDHAMLPTSREQYRRLAASLHQAQGTKGFKVAMVASAVAGEGKTLTAANLALTLSESYRRNVLLIDADLRRPSLHTVFRLEGAPGLLDGLAANGETRLRLHKLSSRLTVLPAGEPTSDPIGALTSDRMRHLIAEARDVFDWVIIDTPPVGLLTDAALLASMADGILLVVKADSTAYDLVNRALDLIGRERVIGVVLNRATELPHRSNYDYSKYYYGQPALPAARE